MLFWKKILFRLGIQLGRILRTRHLVAVLSVAIIISVGYTYYSLAHQNSLFGPDLDNIIGLILVDLSLLLAFVAVVARRVAILFVGRRKGIVGSRLQTRIVVMFSLVALIPTIFMAVFSALFFNFGIQTWFDKKVNAAIEGSVNIAQSYLEDHKNIIKADIRSIASDISRSATLLRSNNVLFNQVVAGLAEGSLSEVIVFTREQVIARSNFGFSLATDRPSEEDLQRADLGEIVILSDEGLHRVRAIVRLDNFLDAYLLVGRLIDADILNYVELTQGAAYQYRILKKNISHLEIKFLIIFVIVSLLLLLMVVWIGLLFAFNIIEPISALLSATQQVKKGNLAVKVPEGHENDEMAALGRAFNRMTEQLQHQQVELVAAQRWAAWSDVARRIAHEIKNPLTPIQLASDRLKRKFTGQVEDREMFEKYINTIHSNITSIGQMVEEFANFARLPAPVFNNYDMVALIQEIVFSRDASSKQITITTHLPNHPVILYGDINQMNRVLLNLIKNAEESIEEYRKELSAQNKTFDKKPLIEVELEEGETDCYIMIKDSGKGFDESMMERLTEPYVTTKSKGTGLGLSIVKKIIEDHQGTISFSNHENGACVTLTFCVNH